MFKESQDLKIPVLPRHQDEEVLVAQQSYSEDEFKQIIRDLGLKVTQQRLIILKCLHEGRRHVTAQELYEKVSRLQPEVGFATVYRFLRSLNEGKFVSEVRMGGLPARYELAPKQHHDHITCVQCGKICEFENPAIEALQEKVAKQFGFKLTHHVLELYGICTDCQSCKNQSAKK